MKRIEEAVSYNMYQTKMDKATFDHIIKYDPTAPTNTYSQWLVNQYLKNKEEFNQYIFNIVKALPVYDVAKERNVVSSDKKDILKFKTFLDFLEYVKNNEDQWKTAIEAKTNNKKVLYKDKEHLVVTPLTHDAARKYGTGTNWCTSTETKEHFDVYNKNGVLFIHRFLNPDGSYEKETYQLYIPNPGGHEMTQVECKDYRDEDVSEELEFNFFKGISDRDFINKIEKRVKDAGGLDIQEEEEEENYTDIIGGYCRCVYFTSNNSLRCRIDYFVERFWENDSNIIENALNKTSSEFNLYIVGQELKTDTTSFLYRIKDFNFFSSTPYSKGLLIKLTGEMLTPGQAYNNAQNEWPDAEDMQDDIELYEIKHELDRTLGSDKIDYIIIDQDDESFPFDDDILRALREFLSFGIEPYRRRIGGSWEEVLRNYEKKEVQDPDTEKTYIILYNPSYDYESKSEPNPNATQKRYENSLDLPYKLPTDDINP